MFLQIEENFDEINIDVHINTGRSLCKPADNFLLINSSKFIKIRILD